MHGPHIKIQCVHFKKQRNGTFQLSLHDLTMPFNFWGDSNPSTNQINWVQILKQIESFIRNSFQIIFHSNDAELAPKLAIDTLEDIKMMHQLGYANVEAHNATILLLMLMLEVGRVSRYYWRS